MSRVEEKNAARRAVSREKILSAATALFARKGIAGTGVQEIADMADLSVGMLYRHFKTKEDIFEALLEKAMENMNSFTAFLENEMLSSADMIKIAACGILENINKDNEYAQFQKLLARASDDVASSSWSMPEPMLEIQQGFLDKITRLIERGQSEGTFRQGCAKSMTQLFLAIQQGLCSWKLSMGDSYASPSPEMLTAFLLKDEHNVYEFTSADFSTDSSINE